MPRKLRGYYLTVSAAGAQIRPSRLVYETSTTCSKAAWKL